MVSLFIRLVVKPVIAWLIFEVAYEIGRYVVVLVREKRTQVYDRRRRERSTKRLLDDIYN